MSLFALLLELGVTSIQFSNSLYKTFSFYFFIILLQLTKFLFRTFSYFSVGCDKKCTSKSLLRKWCSYFSPSNVWPSINGICLFFFTPSCSNARNRILSSVYGSVIYFCSIYDDTYCSFSECSTRKNFPFLVVCVQILYFGREIASHLNGRWFSAVLLEIRQITTQKWPYEMVVYPATVTPKSINFQFLKVVKVNSDLRTAILFADRPSLFQLYSIVSNSPLALSLEFIRISSIFDF